MKKFLNYIKNFYLNLQVQYRQTILVIIMITLATLLNKYVFKQKRNHNDFMVIKETETINTDSDDIEIVQLDKNGNILKGELKKPLKASSKSTEPLYIDTKYNYLLDDLSFDYYFGNDYAPINVVVYSSFQCPHCLNFHNSVFEKLKQNYIDTKLIRYVNRVFIQKKTLYGVVLPYCVKKENQLNIMNELYKQSSKWVDSKNQTELLETIATNNGLTVEEYEKCEKNIRLANRILNKQQEDIKRLDIKGTPTIFVNHRRVNGSVSYEDLSKIIDEELDKVNAK